MGIEFQTNIHDIESYFHANYNTKYKFLIFM